MLGGLLKFKAARKVPNDRAWSKKALALVDMELGSIGGKPGFLKGQYRERLTLVDVLCKS